jgi:hypothetical protein
MNAHEKCHSGGNINFTGNKEVGYFGNVSSKLFHDFDTLLKIR